MPELPEVETVVRSIAPHVLGQTITQAKFSSRFVTRGGLAETAQAVVGATVTGVHRQGKQIFFELDGGLLYAHLGMTGKLLWNAESGKHTHAVLRFAEGTLQFDDTRQFGRLEFYKEMPVAFERLGPDALGIDFETFHNRLKARRGQMKPLLMNQAFLRGLGNIYVDELLFASRIHPRTQVSRLSTKRARVLHEKMQELLKLAITHRGSSISDYVDGNGGRGGFQELHKVYGRTGQPCRECGGAIRRVEIGQRGTHYCPRCQRA